MMVKVDGISQIVKIPATFSNHGIVHAGSDHFLRKPRWFINIPPQAKVFKDAILVAQPTSKLQKPIEMRMVDGLHI